MIDFVKNLFVESIKSSKAYKLSIFFILFGLFCSGYMWFQYQGSKDLLCPISDCAEVMTSPTSLILGVHLSVYGFFFWGVAIIFAFQKLIFKNIQQEFIILFYSIFGFVFTLSLRFVELFIVHSWCIWCWMTFAAAIGYFIVSIIEVRNRQRNS